MKKRQLDHLKVKVQFAQMPTNLHVLDLKDEVHEWRDH